jgi:type VI secretion system secreted protein VgrG
LITKFGTIIASISSDICKDELGGFKMKRKYFIFLVIMAFVTLLYAPIVLADSILGTAQSFAVLGASTVTNTGTTIITGDVGVYAGSAIPGFADSNTFLGPGSHAPAGAGLASGTIYLGDISGTGPPAQAQLDVTKAYNGLAGMPVTQTLTGQDLGGKTLTKGVYFFKEAAQLTGTLQLDGQGLTNAYWVFQIGTTLTTDSNSKVQVINAPGGNDQDYGVFWQVGTSATIGTYTEFEGNILALAAITMQTGATDLNGRLFARVEAVTLDSNVISIVCPNGGPGYNGSLEYDSSGNIVEIGGGGPTPVPEPATMLLLGSGLVGLAGFARRKFKK